MPDKTQAAKAEAFRALHEEGVFVLSNAWDEGSAVLIAQAGAEALGTTSAGVSWAQGRPTARSSQRTR